MNRTLASVILCLFASVTLAAEAPVELGKRITGMYDMSFKPFNDAKPVDRMAATDLLRFVNEKKKWSLVFDKAELPQAIPLRDTRTAQGVDQPGYLTAAVNLIRSSDPSADVLRTDILDTGALRIGLVVAQVRLKENEYSLMQQALIEITPRLYYSLVMHTPAPKKQAEETPEMVEAANVFKAIVESIEPIDLSAIRRDQEDRLFRARALFVNWTPKAIAAALVPEQMLRIRKQNDQGDWDEMGYAYVVEEAADSLPRAGVVKVQVDPQQALGVRVGMRMRTRPEAGKIVDLESWMFVTFDRKHEVWSNVTVLKTPAAETAKEREIWYTEVGASDVEKQRVFDKDLAPGDFKEVDQKNKDRKPNDPEFIPFREVEKYKLLVRTETRSAVGQPLQRELPPFYIPQALGTLLPKLVPLNNPTGYLFATYASDTRQVMLRYIDVGLETSVTIGGKNLRGVPVSERLGNEGDPTIHYLTLEGKYLGTVNPSQKNEIFPTTRDELRKLWADADLSKPTDVKP